MMPLKSTPDDILGRFREVISDPLNLLIHRVPLAGLVEKNEVYCITVILFLSMALALIMDSSASC
jgi:hypothetical protein